MKKKILFCGESSHIKSGFGNFTKEILSRLSKNTDYIVAELSCYRNSKTPKTESWKIYPAAVDPTHTLYKNYTSNSSNVFGAWIFDYVLLDFKPDIVIDIRDPWMFSYQESSPLREYYHWMISPTYDSSPPKIEFIVNFENADTLCFHTEWARKDYTKFSRKNNCFIVNDAVDTAVFKPINQNKKYHKQIHGLDPNSFIIGSVLRNQKRKLIPDLFEVLASVNNVYNNVFLYLHTTFPEVNGWDIPNLLLEYKIYDRVLFTYYCKSCDKYYVSKYQGYNSICDKCNKQSSMSSVTNGVSEKDMASIYNLFDAYVQYAICEGFGIPQTEAASCGIPLITIDSGAMGEIGKALDAKLVPVKHTFKELESGAFRTYPDNDTCARYVIEYLQQPKAQIQDISVSIRKNLIKNYTWDKTYENLKMIIDNINIQQNKRKWDDPYRIISREKVPHNNNIRSLLYSLMDNIGFEYLKTTDLVESLIHNATNGYIMTAAGMRPFALGNALKIIESYINHAINLENIRVGKEPMPETIKDIINYA